MTPTPEMIEAAAKAYEEIAIEETATHRQGMEAALTAALALTGGATTGEPAGWLWTHKATGKKEMRFHHPADLPFNRKHWEWEPLFTSPPSPVDAETEAIAWEATTAGYIKYITDARYQKFSPEVRKWYQPFKCSSCKAIDADAIIERCAQFVEERANNHGWDYHTPSVGRELAYLLRTELKSSPKQDEVVR